MFCCLCRNEIRVSGSQAMTKATVPSHASETLRYLTCPPNSLQSTQPQLTGERPLRSWSEHVPRRDHLRYIPSRTYPLCQTSQRNTSVVNANTVWLHRGHASPGGTCSTSVNSHVSCAAGANSGPSAAATNAAVNGALHVSEVVIARICARLDMASCMLTQL